MWQWTVMDQAMCQQIPVLEYYKPVFPPEALDCLRLSRYEDLRRLQQIQNHLGERHCIAEARSGGFCRTVFDNAIGGCFAEKYYNELPSASEIHQLHDKIQQMEAERMREKEQEWSTLDAQHQRLVMEISTIDCQNTLVDDLLTWEHDPKCKKCALTKQAEKIQLERFEKMMPYNRGEGFAVLMDLLCPTIYRAYRNATWAIVAVLALPNLQASPKDPLTTVHGYYLPFAPELQAPTRKGITLASRTKSFLQTHFRFVHFPVPFEKVAVNNGLKFEYYDQASKLWPAEHFADITFRHHCAIPILRGSPFSKIEHLSKISFDRTSVEPTETSCAFTQPTNVARYVLPDAKVSSNEILAGLPQRPQTLGAQEFIAFQGLLCGDYRLWPSILVEIGSSNLNFSAEAVMVLTQALHSRTGGNHDRDLHTANAIFRDVAFCNKLLSQVERRLQSIATNWRENYCMEILISLILKLIMLADAESAQHAVKLLLTCRKTTIDWIRATRKEFWTTTDALSSERLSHFILWAALLCRRTFTNVTFRDRRVQEDFSRIEINGYSNEHETEDEVKLSKSSLSAFVEASISMQENLHTDPAQSAPLLRNALVRDLKMVSHLEKTLLRSFETNPSCLISAAVQSEILTRGPTMNTKPRIHFNERADGMWAKLDIPGNTRTDPVSLAFHLSSGTFLINGQVLERELPPDIRNSEAIKKLLPYHRLVVYPSCLPGMTYKIGFNIEGHEIHLGFRLGKLVIRASTSQDEFEYIPSSVFQGDQSFDLPASLTENCIHWLRLRDSVIEVRKVQKIWRPQPSNWQISLPKKTAQRRTSTLVDPSSSLFSFVARILQDFEEARHITLYQPQKGALSVELRRFELSFFVNEKGLLESEQLKAEIDVDQDAGTWYGLLPKIILRDLFNPKSRSVIVPLGPLQSERRGPHVAVTIDTTDPAYGRFFLDEVLGRVTCAPEPRLLYTKALLHASTSFCLADPLTGKTGVEEACDILRAGNAQPYAPLTTGSIRILRSIAQLSPVRQFYPPDLRVLETVEWKDSVSIGIQDESLSPLADVIIAKSELLAQFEIGGQGQETGETTSEVQATCSNNVDLAGSGSHLSRRSHTRRRLFQRMQLRNLTRETNPDELYPSRGYHNHGQSNEHVFQVAHLLQQWPEMLPSPPRLHLLMQSWPSIGGYGDGTTKYDKSRLSDLLDTDIASSWGSLANLYRLSDEDMKYQLIFISALICFREDTNMRAVQTLVAFAVLKDLKAVDLPSWPSYTQFRPGFHPKVDYLLQLLGPCALSNANNDSLVLTQRERKALDYAKRAHQTRASHDMDRLAQFFCAQWPCPQPSVEGFSSPVLNLSRAVSLVAVEWHAMFQNHEFEEHLRQVQVVLDRHHTIIPARTIQKERRQSQLLAPRYASICQDLLDMEGPTLRRPQTPARATHSRKMCTPFGNEDISELSQILNELPTSKSIVRQEYIKGLRSSVIALELSRKTVSEDNAPISLFRIGELVLEAKNDVFTALGRLCLKFEESEPGALWLRRAGLWPLATRLSILETLRSTSGLHMNVSMKEAVTEFGVLVTRWQRLLRVEDAHYRRRTQQIEDERKNAGHSNWDPLEYPDWLLLEIDANILIRPIQAEVAFAIISPKSRSNSVLQLNMGQGKTSTIMPMVAAVLANGRSLCRVVVPKALLLQTAQLLQARLGGLLNRELRHLPFTRRTRSTVENIATYGEIHDKIRQNAGVILALPEHMMSFMLSGHQRLLDGRVEEAKQMIKIQKWLNKKCRDVFDESDFSMAVKTQLIYPSGPQVTVDGGLHRWETVEAVLKLVDTHLHGLQHQYPSSIQVVERQHGCFPFVYFLRTDVQDALLQRIVFDVCSGQTSILDTETFSLSENQAIRIFISAITPPKRVIECVANIHKVSPAAGYAIYLLRGLIVHRILLLTLSRRWNVQYGLHPLRDPVAVPYHAKGIPSNLAEWGHVDVSLLFTCLSFYYQGLHPSQLKQSLELILKSDDPAREYEHWTLGCDSLADRHRDWTSINLEDSAQLTEIWHAVRHNLAAIDHFLNSFVFPKHAKQFKVKLQASGWDLPLSGQGETLTTGFSGTNDNRLVLPLTIKQDDLTGLAHTNAEVLTYLLHGRNRGYKLAGRKETIGDRTVYRRMSEPELLKKLYHLRIRILIDCGATILEMTNLTLAKMWLDIDTTAAAAVYFDDENRAWVLSRSGRRTPLLASPFAEDLSNCLVYLDESHTRGTDMKFPPNAHGAVTLSLGQTKDHTVQAVMRLRQLATTQSVTFFAPPEVHQSILDFRNKTDRMHLDSHDVVCWLLEQTSQGLENLQPLYHAQGMNYCRRTQAAIDHAGYLGDEVRRGAYVETLRDHEQQSLKSLYEPRTGNRKKQLKDVKYHGNIWNYVKELERRRKAFQDTGNAVHASALQEVEQEREVAVEAETIREKQNPTHFHPHSFGGLDAELRHFVNTGALRPDQTICEDSFSFLKSTATGLRNPADLPMTPKLLVSSEYRKTVCIPSGKPNDDFLRPVQWLLWSTTTETAIVVSPEEAEALIPICRKALDKLVHLLTYAAPVTPRMLQFNNLNYYAIPSLPIDWSAPLWLRVQLGIFAGRLYFPFEELPYLRNFLGLEEHSDTLADSTSIPAADAVLFDDPSTSSNEQQPSGDDNAHLEETAKAKAIRSVKLRMTKILTFLHAWLSTRARGQDFTHTAMGYVCARKVLTQDHAFFRSTEMQTMIRSKNFYVAAGETGGNVTGDAGDEDDMSDYGDEDLDERRKLTEEELKEVDEGRVEEQFVDEGNVSGDEAEDASEADEGDGDEHALEEE
ncbi:hypothetical protein PV11_06396 [Exophiala sideris]|uniref:ubiquitinyl hydrolase 1 n=1 Tax=Exophiala sideris TaxID=1016849 RepID=A0A0D1WUE1_9EURO|nr:hypothetical protein PV11_06396 [Exophiala sideris]